MKCSAESGFIYDVSSLFEQFQSLKDSRDPKGLRYPLEVVLTLTVMAKLCGEDRPSGIAEWAQYRKGLLIEALRLTRNIAPMY